MSRILDTRSVHGVRTPEEYASKHAKKIADLQREGYEDRLTLETVTEPVAARIDANRWLIDCICGGAAGARVGWSSRCFTCGRVYSEVVFPHNREAIEAELVSLQPFEPMREWSPGQSLQDVRTRQHELTALRQRQLEARR